VPHRSRAFGALILAAVAPALLGTAAPGGEVRASVSGLRSAKGQVVACLTARPADFPSCEHDPAARSVTVPAAGVTEIAFGPVQPGRYAIALFHDENRNGRLDKRLMLPREGFGFSRDAPVRMGPPSFASAAFEVGSGDERQAIRMRYIF